MGLLYFLVLAGRCLQAERAEVGVAVRVDVGALVVAILVDQLELAPLPVLRAVGRPEVYIAKSRCAREASRQPAHLRWPGPPTVARMHHAPTTADDAARARRVSATRCEPRSGCCACSTGRRCGGSGLLAARRPSHPARRRPNSRTAQRRRWKFGLSTFRLERGRGLQRPHRRQRSHELRRSHALRRPSAMPRRCHKLRRPNGQRRCHTWAQSQTPYSST